MEYTENPEYTTWWKTAQPYREITGEYRKLVTDLTDRMKKLGAMMTASDGPQRDALMVVIEDYNQMALSQCSKVSTALVEHFAGKEPEYFLTDKPQPAPVEQL